MCGPTIEWFNQFSDIPRSCARYGDGDMWASLLLHRFNMEDADKIFDYYVTKATCIRRQYEEKPLEEQKLERQPLELSIVSNKANSNARNG